MSSEKITPEHLQQIGDRYYIEYLKGGRLEMAAEVINGQLLIGIYRRDLPGMNADLSIFLEISFQRNKYVNLTFDENNLPILTTENPRRNSPEEIAEYEAIVEEFIRECLKLYPHIEPTRENMDEIVKIVLSHYRISRAAGMSLITWELTEAQIIYTLTKMYNKRT